MKIWEVRTNQSHQMRNHKAVHLIMEGGSVSKSQVILEITGKSKIKCELKRHLSPSLVGTIIRSLPVKGTIHMLGTSCLLYTSPSPRDLSTSRMPSSA